VLHRHDGVADWLIDYDTLVPFFDPASARKPLFDAGVGRCAETLKLHHERQREDRDRDR
jgi:hypothetical protein